MWSIYEVIDLLKNYGMLDVDCVRDEVWEFFFLLINELWVLACNCSR